MPQGIQAWDENGWNVLDVTDRLSNMLGAAWVDGNNGQLGVPGAGQGQQVWGCFIPNQPGGYTFNDSLPRFYVEGDVIRWDWATGNGVSRTSGTLIYGRY